jgi:hypothetical protein
MDAGTATPATDSSPTPPAMAARNSRWRVRDLVM